MFEFVSPINFMRTGLFCSPKYARQQMLKNLSWTNECCINKYSLSTYYVLGMGHTPVNWIETTSTRVHWQLSGKYSYRCQAVIRTVGHIEGAPDPAFRLSERRHLKRITWSREGKWGVESISWAFERRGETAWPAQRTEKVSMCLDYRTQERK